MGRVAGEALSLSPFLPVRLERFVLPFTESFALAVREFQSGRLSAAESICRQMLADAPDHPSALHLAGVIARQSGNSASAVELLLRASKIVPADESIQNDLGGAYLALRQFAAAAACFEHALALRPNMADAQNNLGIVRSQEREFDKAAGCFERALQLNPANPAAHNNLGIALRQQGKFDVARASFLRALQLQPDFVQAYNNLANTCRDQRQLEEAVACCRRAIEIDPRFVDAHLTLGNVLKDQGRLDEALGTYKAALTLDPDLAEAHGNMGNVLKEQGRLDEAVAGYRKAMELRPDVPAYHSNLIYTLGFQPSADARAIHDEACRWARRHAEPLLKFSRSFDNDRSPERRLRIGYVSPDFRAHPVGQFLLPLLESHDHERFEIYCYSAVRFPDALTQRSRSQADVWREVIGLSDETLAGLVRRDAIDVLVDLAMHMEDNRLLVFARKPAPVQVTYLAYCGTTGVGAIDYRLTDPYLEPRSADLAAFSERAIELPETYWCYRPMGDAPDVAGLPLLKCGHVTFGCLNNFCKVTAPTLAAWARILRSLPGSRLLLHSRPGSHRGSVHDEFARQGIAPDRVTFTDRVGLAEYYRLHELIDVALDPFPCCGGTTTCDALWMGVPVVSLAGESSLSRSGLSILSNIAMPELATRDIEEYVKTAVALAADSTRLGTLRASLRGRMQASVVTDHARFARRIESAYRQMWRRWCSR